MGKQANILAFDEVKGGSGVKRSSVAVSSKPSRKKPSSSVKQSASVQAHSAGRGSSSSKGLARSSRANTVRGAGVSSRRSQGISPKQSLAAHDQRSNHSDAHGKSTEKAQEKHSRLQKFLRKRQKDRAGKKFDKQFGGSTRASDASSGPRAAVYKGEMGANHKRAARMQNNGDSKTHGTTFSSLNPFALLSSIKQSPKAIAVCGFMMCLVLTCWFLYTPAQQFYHSVRERDRLQAEYAAIEERNASLASEVDLLQTDAGIEDRAHEQFGWVSTGEETANVNGLSTDASDEKLNFTANIVAGSVEAPETWYSPVLDVVFGVQ